VDLEHDGGFAARNPEGVRDAVRQGHVVAGTDREGLLAAAHGQLSRDQVEAVVQIGVGVQRSTAAGGERRLDDHRLARLVGPDDHQRVEEPLGLAGSGRGVPGQRLGRRRCGSGVRVSHGVPPIGC
jgi:hypothetical protein